VDTVQVICYSSFRSAAGGGRFKPSSDAGLHIGLLHASVTGAGTAATDHYSLGDLQAAGIDYWALGHSHRHQRLSDGQPWIVYPGTLQGRSFKDHETGPKGAVVVTVTDGTVRDATPHALDAVRLMRAQVDVSVLGSAADLRRALASTGERLRSECGGRTIVATCDIVGRTHGWLGAQVADDLWDRLLDDLRQANNGGDAVLWWDSLCDKTDGREMTGQDGVTMYVHRLVDVLRRTPAGLDRLLSEGSAALGPALNVGRPSLDSIEVEHLLNRAERVALGLLEREP
jgi:hypothetical protein